MLKKKETSVLQDIHPLLIFDFRVFVYHLVHSYETIKEITPKETQKIWLKASWAVALNRGFTDLPYSPHTVVVVSDSSPYWRTDYLEERNYPQYKGGRKKKGDIWFEVAQAGIDYVCHRNSPLHFLEFKGYEADDIMGALVRVNAPRLHLLHTVDTDWLGAISDNKTDGLRDKTIVELLFNRGAIKPTTVWCDSARWTPRLRDMEGMNIWSKKRLKKEFDHPTDLWKYKSIYGDRSDNLPPNSPLEVIDLFNPPKEFDLLEQDAPKRRITEIAHNYTANSSIEHLVKALDWFESSGFKPPIVNINQFPVKVNLQEPNKIPLGN